MSRDDLIEARINIVKSRDILDGLRLDYRSDTIGLNDVLGILDEEIDRTEGCCLCSDSNYVADMEDFDIDSGMIYVCQECLMKGIGVCECGFPVSHGIDICGYCGKSADEVDE